MESCFNFRDWLSYRRTKNLSHHQEPKISNLFRREILVQLFDC